MKNLFSTIAFSLITALSFGQNSRLRVQSHDQPIVSYIYLEEETIYDPISGNVQYFLYTGIDNPNNVLNHNLNSLLPQYGYRIEFGTNYSSYIACLTKDFSEYSASDRVFYSDSVLQYLWGPGGGTYYSSVNLKIDLTNVQNLLSTPSIDINSLSVYPNPVNDYLNISINGTENIILTDLNGQIISNDIIYLNGKIDLLNQPNGIYILQIGNQFHKIVKQ
ncbi:MAG: T9SS type A sorting domain-containing protein [Crocinitomicaceae bacterium]|nr:T9SS type A sorting domain-containing protein [Crocinitomicaceae bacterium]